MSIFTEKGFSLVEVLIALAVASLVFIGIGSLARQQADTSFYLHKKIAADILASNLLELYHLEGNPITPDYVEGKQESGSFAFSWSRAVSTSASGFRQAEISIFLQQEPIMSLKYVWVAE